MTVTALSRLALARVRGRRRGIGRGFRHFIGWQLECQRSDSPGPGCQWTERGSKYRDWTVSLSLVHLFFWVRKRVMKFIKAYVTIIDFFYINIY